MKTPTEEPAGPRGPRTTAPDADAPVKQQEQHTREKGTSESDREERHQTEPPRPHGDPLRRAIPS